LITLDKCRQVVPSIRGIRKFPLLFKKNLSETELLSIQSEYAVTPLKTSPRVFFNLQVRDMHGEKLNEEEKILMHNFLLSAKKSDLIALLAVGYSFIRNPYKVIKSIWATAASI
jgi:hypothetical protein